MKIHQRNLPRVLIIGGGFGGLEAAKALRKADVRVTLLDRQNHHLFQPLLYQVRPPRFHPLTSRSRCGTFYGSRKTRR